MEEEQGEEQRGREGPTVGEYLCTLILGTAVLGIEKKGLGQAGQLSVGARVLQVEREAHPPLWAQRRQPDDNPHNHRTHHYPPSKVPPHCT